MKQISLFPLPATVFYPTTALSLHIFEDRYRQMVSDSIESGQWIGMVLLEPDWEPEYYGTPKIKPIGCAGPIETWNRREDGKYDIVLRGKCRFRIEHELEGTPYRQAEVEILPTVHDESLDDPNENFNRLMQRYREFTRLLPTKNAQKVNPDLSECRTLGEAVDRLTWIFELPTEQKQSLLEEQDVLKRHAQILSLIDLKIKIVHQSKILQKSGLDSRRN